MTRTKGIFAAAAAIAIAGCATPPPAVEPESPPPEAGISPPQPSPIPPPVPAPSISDTDVLLAYYDHVRKLSPPEYAREAELVRRLYARAKTDLVRMRYAIVLAAAPGAPLDEARANEILEPVVKSTDTNMRALATMLTAQLQEQRRAHGLQQKLDALMSLDKTLIERGSKTP